MIDNLIAAVKAGGVPRVYKINEVRNADGTPVTYPYAVVAVGTPDKIARTADGQGADLSRSTTQFFGRDIDGVIDIADKGDLDGTWVEGRLVEREMTTPPYRDPDDQGVVVLLHTYRI